MSLFMFICSEMNSNPLIKSRVGLLTQRSVTLLSKQWGQCASGSFTHMHTHKRHSRSTQQRHWTWKIYHSGTTDLVAIYDMTFVAYNEKK